jgi:hypothetical protein
VRFGDHLEPWIAQRVDGHHIAGLEQGDGRYRKSMLRAADDQHLIAGRGQAVAADVASHRAALVAPLSKYSRTTLPWCATRCGGRPAISLRQLGAS